MKKTILLVLISISVNTFSQKKIEEGVVFTKLTMSSENAQVNAQLAMMGDMNTTTYFKGNKSCTEMKSPMAGDNTMIIDGDAKKMLSLLSNPMLGKKYTQEDIKVSDEDLKNITITEKGDSKTILNYVCKGYDIAIKKDGVTLQLTMYATNKIKAPTQNTILLGDQFKGYPMYLETEVNQGGMLMKIVMEATEIREEEVADTKFSFAIPEGYSKMEMPKPPSID